METADKLSSAPKVLYKVTVVPTSESVGDSGKTFKRAKSTVLSSACTYESEALETVEKNSSAPKVLYKVAVVSTKQKH